LSGDYDRALDLAFEVIRINAETHQAWTALSSTFAEIGDTSKALSAMVYAAHLRPKDVAGWLRCASYALDTAAEDEASNLHTARLCYSAALRAEPHNLDARTGKASVSHRQGHLGTAVTDYEKVLKRRPGDIDLVRRLAEACMDTRHAETAVPTAIAAYQRCFRLYMGESGLLEPELDLWYDVGVFVEMYAYTGQYLEAIRELKSLARWLLGRGGEKFWDQWQDDDREWDLDDHRRSQMPRSIEMPVNPEGLNEHRRLPSDLRARLAIYRFRLEQPDEALVSTCTSRCWPRD
jgi:general transcription factor 3C polypeptide 3 (transcription factor C subunit 4)